MGAKTIGIAVAPAAVDLQVATDGPAQFLQGVGVSDPVGSGFD
jgi:hypothetical protein